MLVGRRLAMAASWFSVAEYFWLLDWIERAVW